MKVSVYKEIDGTMAILIQASPGSGKAPVVLPGVTREGLRKAVSEAVQTMREPRGLALS